MKIFFASSTIDGTDHEEIVDYLKEKGHKVFHYLHDVNSPNDEYSYGNIIEEINQADVFIGEMSRASQTLGFQLAYALHISKPCLYLYGITEKGRPSGVIGDIPARGMKIKRHDKNNYKKILDEFIKFAEKQMFTARTSFMSTREIDSYLSSESHRQGISKGELIRQILHNAIIG